MTKKAFKYAMQRGLGSCVIALKNEQNMEAKQKFLPIVLWGCSHDMAYDAQCEGCRSFYLYELISEFADSTPFLDKASERLFRCIGSSGWEFEQACELLAYFAADGEVRAREILADCYDVLLGKLAKKRRRTGYGMLPERDQFEALCIELMDLCQGDREQLIRQYRILVKDMGALIQNNPLYSFVDFEWFQDISEEKLGRRTVERILRSREAEEPVRVYALSMEECLNVRRENRAERRKQEPRCADEIYQRLKAGKQCPLLLGHRLMREKQEQEVLKLAAYYKEEENAELRYKLLQLLANQSCAWTLDIPQLIRDARAEDTVLAERAMDALSYRRDSRVKEYARELWQKGIHKAWAVSMFAANYEEEDRVFLTEAVKQIPILYDSGEWHQAFSDVMRVFDAPGRNKPKEILPYLYRNTLCSFCREAVVREMGRRRMLTRELLEELRYDCNEEIRIYANKRVKCFSNEIYASDG